MIKYSTEKSSSSKAFFLSFAILIKNYAKFSQCQQKDPKFQHQFDFLTELFFLVNHNLLQFGYSTQDSGFERSGFTEDI